MLISLLERVEAAQRRTADAINANAAALRTFETASPYDVLQRGVGSSGGRQLVTEAMLEESASNYGVARTMMEHMGFARQW